MVAKFLIFFGLVAAATSLAVPVAPVSKLVYAEPEAPAQYQYTYSVQDSHSGDIKDQQETRNGDAVQGSYSLIQPDGVRRIVEYTSDDHQGFNAIVRYEGHAVQQAPVANIAYASAPVTKIAYAPAPVTKVAYAPAPIAKVAYAAPFNKEAYAQAPIAYAAPAQISYAAAPIAKLGYAAAPIAKVAYSENLGRVSYSSPVVAYQH